MESQHFPASRFGRLFAFLLATVLLASLWPESERAAHATVDLAAKSDTSGAAGAAGNSSLRR